METRQTENINQMQNEINNFCANAKNIRLVIIPNKTQMISTNTSNPT